MSLTVPALAAVLSIGCGGMAARPDALVIDAGQASAGDSAAGANTRGTSTMGAEGADADAAAPPAAAACPPNFPPGIGVVDADGGRCSSPGLMCRYGFNPPPCGGREALCENGSWSVWHTDPSYACFFEGGSESDPPDVISPVVATDAGPPLDTATPVWRDGSCVSWSMVRDQPFIGAGSTSQSVTAVLADATKRVIASWIGHAISPWGAWDLRIEFTADNHYVARSYNGTAGGGSFTPPPFYYGTELECDPLKQWRLTGVSASGDVLGQLDVPFSYGPPNCGLPAWQGELSNLVFDAGGNRLQFSFKTSDGYGPIVYDLWRVC